MAFTAPSHFLQVFRIGLLAATLVQGVALAQLPDSPDWNVRQQGKNWVLVPRKLSSNQTLQITVFAEAPRGNQSMEQWLTRFIQQDSQGRGQVLQALQGVQAEKDMWVGSVGVQVKGQPQVLLYAAIEAGEGQVQAFLMQTSMDRTLTETYGPFYSRLIAGALKEQHPQSAQSSTPSPGLPKGAKMGGKLEPGTYTCQRPGYQNKVQKFNLNLYDNGEYRLYDKDDGTYTYDARSGRIDISVTDDLYNSDYDQDTFAVYFRDQNNHPTVYGQDGGYSQTTCVYAGKNQKPSPSAQEEADRKKREEEARFKWVTAPGKGVQLAQMDGLYVHYELDVEPLSGMVMQLPKLALLLKDGTAYTGLRVPPEDLDVKASRKNEPSQWTRWKRDGKKVLLLEKNKWAAIDALKVLPALKGETLQGSFKHMSSSFQAGLGGSTFTTYFQFDRKGQFAVSNSVLSSTGILQANNGFSSSASSTTDQTGTTSNVAAAGGGDGQGGGPTAVVTSQKDDRTAHPEKAGQYTLNGYALQLKQGDGKVVRKLFFFLDSKKEDLWIEETPYYPAGRYN